MDVKLIPGDSHGRAVTANMFTGLVYTVDPTDGSVVQSFDCETIVPHIEVPVPGGMVQLLATPGSGDRLIFASFQAGQVGMLDISNPNAFRQLSIVNLGLGAGPHDIDLTEDDSRLVVTDYFLDEDDFGRIHFDGDRRVRVINVTHDALYARHPVRPRLQHRLRAPRPSPWHRHEVGLSARTGAGSGAPLPAAPARAACR